jgi:threonine dehydrogenase-like Zn-dependent dehydrogenase
MTGSSRAVMFDGALRVIERPQPTPATDEALIRMRLGGICNTDLELLKGYKGFSGVLGHEFVGKVVEGLPEWVGRRVVGEINISCGECDLCRRGVPTQCRRRRVLGLADYDGAFADVFRLAARNLVPVPDSVPDDVAVFTEPLAAACQILDAVHLRPTDRIVLIGAGKIGMLAAQVLRLTGADLTVIVRHERQAGLLRRWGIRAVERADLPDGEADVVVDCTGTPGGFADTLDLVRPRGTVVLKSTYAGTPQADLTRIVVNEIRVVGNRCGPFEAALRLLEQDLVDVQSLIDARYPLAEAVKAFDHAARPGTLKILLAP